MSLVLETHTTKVVTVDGSNDAGSGDEYIILVYILVLLLLKNVKDE